MTRTFKKNAFNKKILCILLFLWTGLAAISSQAIAEFRVLASSPPVFLLAQEVFSGVQGFKLDVINDQSPHKETLKPSQVRKMHDADVIFYIHPKFESFLSPIQGAKLDAKTISLIHPIRNQLLNSTHEHNHDHDHDHGHEDEHDDHAHHENSHMGHADHQQDHHDDHDNHDQSHGHSNGHSHEEHSHSKKIHTAEVDTHSFSANFNDIGGKDLHIWLSPDNAWAMAQFMVNQISQSGLNAKQIQAIDDNLDLLKKELDESSQRINALLAKQRPSYWSMHQAYQYFENDFNINAASVTGNFLNLVKPSQVNALFDQLNNNNIRCIWFDDAQSLEHYRERLEQLDVKLFYIEPSGMDLIKQNQRFIVFFDNLADGLEQCSLPI